MHGMLATFAAAAVAVATVAVAVGAQQFAYFGSAAGQSTERFFSGIATDGATNLYTIANPASDPATLMRFTAAPFTRVAASALPATQGTNCSGLALLAPYLYVACSPPSGSVLLRRNVADLSAAGVITRTTPNEETAATRVVTNATHTYMFTRASPTAAVVRFNTGNFTYRDTLSLVGIQSVDAAIINAAGTWLLFATDTAPVVLCRLPTDDALFTRFNVFELPLNSGENGVSGGLAEDGAFAYVGTTRASTATLVKVRISDMLRVGSVTLLSNFERDVRGINVDVALGMAYVIVGTGPGVLVRAVRIATAGMTRVESVDAGGSQTDPRGVVAIGLRIFVASSGAASNDPGDIVAFNLFTTSTSTVTPPPTSSTTTRQPSTAPATTTVRPTNASTTAPPPTTTTRRPPTAAPTAVPTMGPDYGDGDDSVAIGGVTAVGILAGIAAGFGVLLLVLLFLLVTGRIASPLGPKQAPVAGAAAAPSSASPDASQAPPAWNPIELRPMTATDFNEGMPGTGDLGLGETAPLVGADADAQLPPGAEGPRDAGFVDG